MGQKRMQKPRTRVSRNTGTHVEDTRRETDTEALKLELDDLLDTIDEALEVNAEQFIADYVQKGGE